MLKSYCSNLVILEPKVDYRIWLVNIHHHPLNVHILCLCICICSTQCKHCSTRPTRHQAMSSTSTGVTDAEMKKEEPRRSPWPMPLASLVMALCSLVLQGSEARSEFLADTKDVAQFEKLCMACLHQITEISQFIWSDCHGSSRFTTDCKSAKLLEQVISLENQFVSF